VSPSLLYTFSTTDLSHRRVYILHPIPNKPLISIGIGITGTLTLRSVIVLGTSVLVGRLVLLGLGLGCQMRLASELTVSFPIPLVNLLDKISEVV
jgi:hypothetical protein